MNHKHKRKRKRKGVQKLQLTRIGGCPFASPFALHRSRKLLGLWAIASVKGVEKWGGNGYKAQNNRRSIKNPPKPRRFNTKQTPEPFNLYPSTRLNFTKLS